MDADEREIRSASQDLCRQLLNPLSALNECVCCHSPGKGEQWRIRLCDQVSGPVPFTSFEGMQNGWGRPIVLGIPAASTSMQDGYQISVALLQLGTQGLSK